jgi:hypothetical protein
MNTLILPLGGGAESQEGVIERPCQVFVNRPPLKGYPPLYGHFHQSVGMPREHSSNSLLTWTTAG